MQHVDRRTFMKQTGGGIAALSLAELVLAAPPRTDDPIKIALIGAGRQGRTILAELQKLEAATVTIICDSDQRRLDAGIRRAAGATPVSDYRRILSDHPEIDAVVIATPTHLHRQIAIDCIEAGKHVYCEAPLASSIEDCRAIVEAARHADTLFHAGLQARSNPVYQLARTFYLSDSVRDTVALRAQHHRKTSWRTPADTPERDRALNWRLDPDVSLGLAGEWGTHQFDVFHWYLDRYPVSVRGGGGIYLHKDGRTVPDTIACDLVFADGVTLQYAATLTNSYGGEYEVLFGTNAAIKLAWSHGWMFK
ncbi:MAG: Gfo/Idh/MocA family oxidoreductase, partial [Phycisphaerales bacterium]|nr:Gfo/Idh/MocA family oxidoreductase [Phycisphaerales bacterium]